MPESVARWLTELPKPCGIFTQYSYHGPYLCRACQKLGIRVPQDIAIIGTDGFDVSLWCDPPLTSAYQPVEAVGMETVRLALEMLAGRPTPSDHIAIGGVDIIPRGSTTTAHLQGLDIRSALNFIDRHACESIRVQDVVDMTQSVTRQTFGKHFRQWTGSTPAQALRQRKLAEAKRMLRDTDISVTTLSRACGFCDDIEFRKVFRKHEGMSPTDFRKSQRP